MAYRQSTAFRVFSLKGFTIVELLVVLSVILILASLLFSALSTAKNKAAQIKCLNNLRQIQITHQLYSIDNNKLVANGFVIDTNNIDEKFWVQGHLNNAITRDLTNSALLVNNRFALFADYLSVPSIYKCPSDKKKFKLFTSSQTSPKHRTYGLNWHLGLIREDFGIFTKDIIKKEDFIISPINTFTFVDINPESVCWPVFGVFTQERIFMYPSPLHNNGGNLAFADGHVERKKWLDKETITPTSVLWHSHSQKMIYNKDFEWLIERRGIRD